jgi:hypothetical protein
MTLSGGGLPITQTPNLTHWLQQLLNLSNCCLQIDDEEKVIKEITDKIKKLAHIPVHA